MDTTEQLHTAVKMVSHIVTSEPSERNVALSSLDIFANSRNQCLDILCSKSTVLNQQTLIYFGERLFEEQALQETAMNSSRSECVTEWNTAARSALIPSSAHRIQQFLP